MVWRPEIVIIRGQQHEVVDCGSCGVVFTVPAIMRDHHRRKGGFSYCLNGHAWGWKRGTEQEDKLTADLERIQRERDMLKQDAARAEDEAWALRTEIARQEKERRRVLARANAGVCQDCNRTFANVVRHRQTKHKLTCLKVVA